MVSTLQLLNKTVAQSLALETSLKELKVARVTGVYGNCHVR